MLMYDKKIWQLISDLKHQAIADGLVYYINKATEIMEELDKQEEENVN